jgi:Fic family protein
MVIFAEAIDADVLRIRNEYLEMPGMHLTAPQAARLTGVTLAHAIAMLEELEDEGFLIRAADGTYHRGTDLDASTNRRGGKACAEW